MPNVRTTTDVCYVESLGRCHKQCVVRCSPWCLRWKIFLGTLVAHQQRVIRILATSRNGSLPKALGSLLGQVNLLLGRWAKTAGTKNGGRRRDCKASPVQSSCTEHRAGAVVGYDLFSLPIGFIPYAARLLTIQGACKRLTTRGRLHGSRRSCSDGNSTNHRACPLGKLYVRG